MNKWKSVEEKPKHRSWCFVKYKHSDQIKVQIGVYNPHYDDFLMANAADNYACSTPYFSDYGLKIIAWQPIKYPEP